MASSDPVLVSGDFIATFIALQAEVARLARKLDGFNGPGVSNSHDTVSIDVPQPTQAGVIFPPTVKYLKLLADWASATPNRVTGNPCDEAGNIDSSGATITAALVTPDATVPAFSPLKAGDVCGYVPSTVTADVVGTLEPTYRLRDVSYVDGTAIVTDTESLRFAKADFTGSGLTLAGRTAATAVNVSWNGFGVEVHVFEAADVMKCGTKILRFEGDYPGDHSAMTEYPVEWAVTDDTETDPCNSTGDSLKRTKITGNVWVTNPTPYTGDGVWIQNPIPGFVVTHIGPKADVYETYHPVSAISLDGTTLHLTPKFLTTDAKGHRNGETGGSSGDDLTVDLSSLVPAPYTGDGLWIQTPIAGGVITHIGPSTPGSGIPPVAGMTVDTGSGGTVQLNLTPNEAAFDIKGHYVSFAGASPISVDLGIPPVPLPPGSGTFTLQSVDGMMSWV